MDALIREQFDAGDQWSTAPAYTTSLDAAQALHEAVLPEYGYGCECWEGKVIRYVWPLNVFWEPDWQLGQDNYRSRPNAVEALAELDPAAWCAAILKAKILGTDNAR